MGKLLSLGGRLVLINSMLTNMVLYIISFFYCLKESCISSIIIDQDSFGKGTVRKRSIGWSNGVSSVDPKISGGLECMTSRSKTRLCLVNGFSSYLLRMVFGICSVYVSMKYIYIIY
jgi:hypothetical protein